MHMLGDLREFAGNARDRVAPPPGRTAGGTTTASTSANDFNGWKNAAMREQWEAFGGGLGYQVNCNAFGFHTL